MRSTGANIKKRPKADRPAVACENQPIIVNRRVDRTSWKERRLRVMQMYSRMGRLARQGDTKHS